MTEKKKPCLRHVFIGYDEREDIAYQIARYSILSNIGEGKTEIQVHKLDHRTLRNKGLFTREWLIESNGSYKDIRDKRPFSTQFAHSRFLIPAYAKMLGLQGQALFIDCDFMFKGDLNDLFDLTENNGCMLSCVKHNYIPELDVKMDNCSQKAYAFKLWSAMMMFNLNEPRLYEMLLPDRVNTWEGGALHRFIWISQSHQMVSSEIGDIPECWQFIPDHSEPRVKPEEIRCIHWTMGGPWFEHMRKCKYANEWWKEYKLYIENVEYPFVEEMEIATNAH